MTLYEAIQSGRRYKRPSWPDYYSHSVDTPDSLLTIKIVDLLAFDWELEPQVTITEWQLEQACKHFSVGPSSVGPFFWYLVSLTEKRLCKSET